MIPARQLRSTFLALRHTVRTHLVRIHPSAFPKDTSKCGPIRMLLSVAETDITWSIFCIRFQEAQRFVRFIQVLNHGLFNSGSLDR